MSCLILARLTRQNLCHRNCNRRPHGLSVLVSTLVSALVATAGGINCNNGLAAVMAGHMGLMHWSMHWLQ